VGRKNKKIWGGGLKRGGGKSRHVVDVLYRDKTSVKGVGGGIKEVVGM
jgi:hypothetical protein